MSERITTLINEFVLSWMERDELKKESVQSLLDQVREIMGLDSVYVLKVSEMCRYEFKFAFISCSDPVFDFTGRKQVLSSARYDKILNSYGIDNVRIIKSVSGGEKEYSRCMEYGFNEGSVTFGVVGFYIDKPHVWSEDERECIKKLGRAVRIYLDSYRRRVSGYNRTQEYVSALTHNSVYAFYLDANENYFTTLRNPLSGIPMSGEWDKSLGVFAQQVLSGPYSKEILRLFSCSGISDNIRNIDDPLTYTFMCGEERHVKWYTISAVPLDYIDNGLPHHVIISFEDVTESVEKDEKNRLAFQLLHNTYVRISFIDLNNDYIYDMKRISDDGDEVAESGNSFERSILKCAERYVRADDAVMFKNMLSADNLKYQIRKQKGNIVFTYARKIGAEYQWVKSELIPVYDYSDEKSHLMWYVTNISEEKAREESYRQRQAAMNSELIEQMKTIQAFSSIYFAAWMLDVEKNSVVPVIEPDDLTDVAADGDIGNAFLKIAEKYSTDDKNEMLHEFLNISRLSEVLRTQNNDSVECRGEKLEWCRLIAIPFLKDEEGNIRKMLFAFQDVSKHKADELEAQNKLIEAYEEAKRANLAKSSFLSRMSHDIRTPINGIIGLLEISENHPDDIALLAENRKKEKVAARHLLSLLNDVLNMSKLEDGTFELEKVPFNMLELYNDTITMTELKASEAGITFIHDSGKNITSPEVFGSPLHVRQILLNILVNAVKYNVKYGSLTYTSDIADYDGFNVSYRFRIADTGTGMSEEFQKHIFEPFTQEHSNARSKYQGSGLGMAIVKNLIDRMNGKIYLESTQGKGTVFTITLPFEINRNPVYSEPVKMPEKKPSIDGMKILIAEDNELNLEIVRCMLSDAGADVDEARNGREAVDKFMRSDAGTYDAILLDIMMPVMDGLAASRYIRTSDKADAASIPIIALTANAFTEDAEKSRRAGMNAHLTKPLDINNMILTLSKYK